MLNIVVPNVVLEAFEIIIPIATWDLFDGFNFSNQDYTPTVVENKI